MRKNTPIRIILISMLMCLLLVPSTACAKDKGDDAIRELVFQLEDEIETLRGLDFLRPVDSKLVSDEELAEYLRKEIAKQMPPEKEYAIMQVYAHLGIIPLEPGFIEVYESLLEEQAGGIYDPDGDRLLVVASNLPGLNEDGEIEEGGMMGFLGVDPATLVKTVLAHELCHALEDQHFKFNDAFKEIMKESSSDQEFAIQSLVEGSATRLMIDYMTGGVPLTGMQKTLNRMMTNIVSQISMDVPQYYKRTLTSPYLNGEMFVSYIMSNKGWSAIDKVYRNPPESMEQILHPLKYSKNPDHPTEIVLADFTEVLGSDYKELLQDTLGEFVIDILFSNFMSRADFNDVPIGWDGDRLAGYEDTEGNITIIWHTVWDTAADAGEFSDTMRTYLSLRKAKLHQTESIDGPSTGWRKYTDETGREFLIVHDEHDVIFIDNAPGGSTDDLYMLVLDGDEVNYNLEG